MPRPLKIHYALILLILIVALTGCELRRTDSQISDPGPVSELPTPTLAPLGSDGSDLAAEATPIATVINVQPTATESSLGAGQAEHSVQQEPTSQPPVDLSAAEPAAGNGQAEQASAAPETFMPPTAVKPATEEPVIVDATSTELPDGGPIAANPPASQTTGDYYGTAAYDGTTYTVQPGDTLFSLSLRYDTTVEAIMFANDLTSDLIYQGQVLTIRPDDGNYSSPVYGPALPGNEGRGHVVARGETLFSLAQRYGTSVEAIAEANGIAYPYLIYEGQTLALPTYGVYPDMPAPGNVSAAPGGSNVHTVAPGETLYSIANRYGTTAQALAVANGISNPNQIYVGQVLYLP